MNSILDQQRQELPATTTVDCLVAIEECAAAALDADVPEETTEDDYYRTIATLYEMVEGLAQAVRQLYVEKEQGWAPVLEDKR